MGIPSGSFGEEKENSCNFMSRAAVLYNAFFYKSEKHSSGAWNPLKKKKKNLRALEFFVLKHLMWKIDFDFFFPFIIVV